MAQETKVLKEFDHSWGGNYRVEREYHGWDWRNESIWHSKAAAFYVAEELSRVSGDKTRVVLVN